MSDKNKAISRTIIFSTIFLLIGGVVGYFIGTNIHSNAFRENQNFQGNFLQINESVKTEIASFFDSLPSAEEINSYCQNNPSYCMEYCRSINPSSEKCVEINENLKGEMPLR
jgi:hypothetical protein